MVINHQYRFCYFAVPRTGSQATTKLLVDEFGSQEIMRMHTSFDEFQEQASEEEKQYFTFCTVRNPLDSLVSAYFKKKTDHRGRFSRGTFLRSGRPVSAMAMEKYRYITEQQATFAQYFEKFHVEPYRLPRHESTVRQVDYVMKFEDLDSDFAKFLQQFNLPLRSIPQVNKTKQRSAGFLSYYTPGIIPQAIAVTKDIMKEYGYSFPVAWNAADYL
jgi:hypothetical protein